MLDVGKVSPRSALSPLLLAWFVCAFFFTALIILFIGRYAEKEEVTGRVITRDVLRISSERTGYIEEVLAQPGAIIHKNQPLLRIRNVDPDTLSERGGKSGSTNNVKGVEALLVEVSADEQKAQASYDVEKDLLKLQLDEVSKSLDLNSKIYQSIQYRVNIAARERQHYERLAKQGAVSEAALHEVIARHESALQELVSNELDQSTAQQKILELKQRASDADYSRSTRLSTLASQKQDLLERLDTLKKAQEYVLLSPVDGEIDASSVFAGARAEAGNPLMLIRTHTPRPVAPTVMLDVKASSIGFAEPGTEVVLRIDSFPYERYGVIKGHILRTPSSTLVDSPLGTPHDEQSATPTYLVEVQLDFAKASTKIQQAWLRDGMTVKASLKHEELNLFEWLFLPVVKGMQRNPDYLSEFREAPVGESK
jgi:membrane fusion protein